MIEQEGSQQQEAKKYQLNPQLVEMGLAAEYQQGIPRLIRRIEKKGIRNFFLVGFGSLTRTDKPLRKHAQNPQLLDSDADFLCVTTLSMNNVRGPGIAFELITTGEAHMERQQNSLREAPFSRHIPYFQVEILTQKKCLSNLQIAYDKLKGITFTGPSYDDNADYLRSYNEILALSQHLLGGNLLFGTIPPAIQEAAGKVQALRTALGQQLHNT